MCTFESNFIITNADYQICRLQLHLLLLNMHRSIVLKIPDSVQYKGAVVHLQGVKKLKITNCFHSITQIKNKIPWIISRNTFSAFITKKWTALYYAFISQRLRYIYTLKYAWVKNAQKCKTCPPEKQFFSCRKLFNDITEINNNN